MSISLAFFAMVGLAGVATLGDYFLKLASLEQSHLLCNRWFALGCLTYCAGASGWVYILRTSKLSTVGVVYSLSTVLFLTILGVFVFHEELNSREAAGIVLASLAIFLLGRC